MVGLFSGSNMGGHDGPSWILFVQILMDSLFREDSPHFVISLENLLPAIAERILCHLTPILKRDSASYENIRFENELVCAF